MTKRKPRAEGVAAKAPLGQDEDDPRSMVEAVVGATLGAEMTAALEH